MQRRMAAASGSILILVAALVLGPRLFGQVRPPAAPEKLLPAGTLIYFGWDGSDAHAEAWKKTAAYDALIQSGLGEIVTKLTAWGERQVGPQPLRTVTNALEHLTHKGLYLAITAPSAGQGLPMPQLTIVVPEAGPAAKEIGGLLEQIGLRDFHQQQIEGRAVTRGVVPGLPAAEVGWWAEGAHLVIAAGIGAVDAALQVAAGKAPHLGTNPLARKYQAKAEFEVALVSWIDLATIRKMTAEIPIPGPTPDSSMRVSDVLKTLGLDNVGPLAVRWGMKDQALWSETTLEAPAPRTGALAFADQKPISLKDLPALPAAADGFYAGRLDWSQTMTGILKMSDVLLKQFGPPGSPTGEQLQAVVRQETGIDLQKDLFDPLGDVMVLYGDAHQGMFGMGLGLAISVDDAAALRSTFDKLLTKLMQAAGKNVIVQSVRRGERTMNTLEFPEAPFVSPSLAIDGKWLIVGLYPQTVDAFLLRQQAKLPRWEASPAMTQALAELPKEYTSLTYSDPREGLRTALGLAPTLISFAQMSLTEQRRRQAGPEAKIDLPVTASDFPPAEAITRSLFVNVSVSSVTKEEEIRWTSRTSFPAVPLLGGAGIGSGGAAAPVLVALLLPAVQQSREAARRSQSRNNLKQIALALHNFYEANNGLPAGTHQNDRLKAEKRLSWMVDILPYVDQNALQQRLDMKKGWDDPANADAVKVPIALFLNPGVTAAPDPQYAATHYVGIAGVGVDAPTLPLTDKRAGVFGYNRIARFPDILDGLSNTIGVTEASKDYGPWSAGGPATIRALTKKPYINGPDGLGGPYRGGMNVMMMDGSVRFVSENIDPAILEALSTIAGGERIGNF